MFTEHFHFAALESSQSHRQCPNLSRQGKGIQHIWRIAAGAESKHHVVFAEERPQLLGKNVRIAGIVRPGGL